jgi:hypothetical protein
MAVAGHVLVLYRSVICMPHVLVLCVLICGIRRGFVRMHPHVLYILLMYVHVRAMRHVLHTPMLFVHTHVLHILRLCVNAHALNIWLLCVF